MRVSSPQLLTRSADSQLHIATPPAYRAASLFDVEWNTSPPASPEHNLFETRWNTEVADPVRGGVARQRRLNINTLPSSVIKIPHAAVLAGEIVRLRVPGKSLRRNHRGNIQRPSSLGNLVQHSPADVLTSVERSLQTNTQDLTQERYGSVGKASTRLFDTSDLSKLRREDQHAYNKTARAHVGRKRKTRMLVDNAGFPKKDVPRRYEGFSERTILLLTAKSASDFVRESRVAQAPKLGVQESVKNTYDTPKTQLFTELPVKNGPIWGRDAFYSQPARYRSIPGRNALGRLSTKQSMKGGQKGVVRNKSRRKIRTETLGRAFNDFMDSSTTHPLAFRKVVKGHSPSTALDDHKLQLEPVQAAGRCLSVLRDSISKSVQSRFCGLSLREIENVTNRTSRMRPSGTQSLPKLRMTSTVGEPRRADAIIDVPVVSGALEEEIYMELRTRQRSRQSSSRQNSRSGSTRGAVKRSD